jgi:hypothetical protein
MNNDETDEILFDKETVNNKSKNNHNIDDKCKYIKVITKGNRFVLTIHDKKFLYSKDHIISYLTDINLLNSVTIDDSKWLTYPDLEQYGTENPKLKEYMTLNDTYELFHDILQIQQEQRIFPTYFSM